MSSQKSKQIYLQSQPESINMSSSWKKTKKPSYKPIYSLRPVELKIFKTYIETNLVNGFIWTSKLPTGAPILFVRKLDGSFCLSVNY